MFLLVSSFTNPKYNALLVGIDNALLVLYALVTGNSSIGMFPYWSSKAKPLAFPITPPFIVTAFVIFMNHWRLFVECNNVPGGGYTRGTAQHLQEGC